MIKIIKITEKNETVFKDKQKNTRKCPFVKKIGNY